MAAQRIEEINKDLQTRGSKDSSDYKSMISRRGGEEVEEDRDPMGRMKKGFQEFKAYFK